MAQTSPEEFRQFMNEITKKHGINYLSKLTDQEKEKYITLRAEMYKMDPESIREDMEKEIASMTPNIPVVQQGTPSLMKIQSDITKVHTEIQQMLVEADDLSTNAIEDIRNQLSEILAMPSDTIDAADLKLGRLQILKMNLTPIPFLGADDMAWEEGTRTDYDFYSLADIEHSILRHCDELNEENNNLIVEHINDNWFIKDESDIFKMTINRNHQMITFFYKDDSRCFKIEYVPSTQTYPTNRYFIDDREVSQQEMSNELYMLSPKFKKNTEAKENITLS